MMDPPKLSEKEVLEFDKYLVGALKVALNVAAIARGYAKPNEMRWSGGGSLDALIQLQC